MIAPKNYTPRLHVEKAREKQGHHAGLVGMEMPGQTQSHVEQRDNFAIVCISGHKWRESNGRKK